MVFAMMTSALGRERPGEVLGLLDEASASDAPSTATTQNPATTTTTTKRRPPIAADPAMEVGENCLLVLKGLSVVTSAAGGLVVAVNSYRMVEVYEALRIYAIHCYTVVLGVLIIAAEVDKPDCLLDKVKFLKIWPAKGLLIVFAGLLTLTDGDDDAMAQDAVAVLVIFIGATYVLLGLLCVRAWRFDDDDRDDDDLTLDSATLGQNAPSWLDPSKDHALV
mmetsp:Transcript_4624/g.11902  ORF Transcript_4624/g.11902 Transcript_4624/m.11902 type:complete len:221 (-) Transcript_4624:224-886(-)